MPYSKQTCPTIADQIHVDANAWASLTPCWRREMVATSLLCRAAVRGSSDVLYAPDGGPLDFGPIDRIIHRPVYQTDSANVISPDKVEAEGNLG